MKKPDTKGSINDGTPTVPRHMVPPPPSPLPTFLQACGGSVHPLGTAQALGLQIEEERMNDHFVKYHLRGLNRDYVLHQFTGAHDEEFHSHPFHFVSHVLSGGYVEQVAYRNKRTGVWRFVNKQRLPGTVHRVNAFTIHRITKLPRGFCNTLILPGRWRQEPAFFRFENGQAFRRQWNEEEFKPYHP